MMSAMALGCFDGGIKFCSFLMWQELAVGLYWMIALCVESGQFPSDGGVLPPDAPSSSFRGSVCN